MTNNKSSKDLEIFNLFTNPSSSNICSSSNIKELIEKDLSPIKYEEEKMTPPKNEKKIYFKNKRLH